VSSADKIHNTESFLRDFEKEGESYGRRFGSSIKNRIWFHEQVLTVVTEKLGADHALVAHFRGDMEKFRLLEVI
jgi:hypothetical protein